MAPGEDRERFLAYHGLTIRHREDGLSEVYGESKCRHLHTDKAHGTKCAIYADRPAICRDWTCPKCNLPEGG